jgi:SAM-dependent methyltransferase
MFDLYQCAACGHGFINNPWDEFEKIYDAEYYQGRGSDPLVDYLFELQHPEETVRRYEWAGIVQAVGSLVPLNRPTRWLDFGCGNGGLVRHLRARTDVEAHGFEEGWIAEEARRGGIPLLDRAALAAHAGTFDVVSAIEVLEHSLAPLETLRELRALLKPGGLLFLTTGNAAPFARDLVRWPYVAPEIHVSFFEPRTLARALEMSGFRPTFPGFTPGFARIIQFKILKNLKVRRVPAWSRMVPWTLLARLCDARWKITALPVGWAKE